MIYDGFIFFNELDLLDIRLHELYDVVDKFILVESKWKHNGEEKSLWYADHKTRFQEFSDKIIHIIDNDITAPGILPCYAHPPWGSSFCSLIENQQRKGIRKGLTKAKSNDIVIVSDVDEIPESSWVRSLNSLPSHNHTACAVMNIYYYYLNNQMMNSGWSGSVGFKFGRYDCMQKVRDTRMNGSNDDATRIRTEGAGWHFSYVGSPDMIAEKLLCMADTINEKGKDGYTVNWVKNIIDKQGDVRCRMRGDGRVFRPQPLSHMPQYVQDNPDKFAHILKNI